MIMKRNSVLFVGCGDLGCRSGALLLASGWRVAGMRRDPSRLPAGFEGIAGDYTRAASMDFVAELQPDYIVSTFNPSERSVEGYQRGFASGAKNLLAGLGSHRPRAIFAASSTRVYAERDGGWVDEASALAQDDPRARAIIAAEQTLLGSYTYAPATATALIAIGHAVQGSQGYTTLGYSTSDIRAQNGVATWSTVSDERYKKDITDSTAGLSFINALQPRTWNYRTLGELPETFNAYEEGSTEVFKNTQTNHGFIAQEVKAAIDADSGLKDGFRLWDDRDDGSQEVAEAALIPILVKAIQELTARLETLEG
jgi:hypothetical protein